jgi:hypothetical protein
MNTMPVENHRIIDPIKLSTKEHKDAYIEKEDKGIAVANPEPAGTAGKPPETAQGLAPAPATDPNAVAFVILNSYGRHEIKASFWKFSLALAKSDDWQAALLFYRARAARDPVAFIRAGFTKGYIWQSSIEEIQSPPSVKAWINATILRESLYPLRNILKGV